MDMSTRMHSYSMPDLVGHCALA